MSYLTLILSGLVFVIFMLWYTWYRKKPLYDAAKRQLQAKGYKEEDNKNTPWEEVTKEPIKFIYQGEGEGFAGKVIYLYKDGDIKREKDIKRRD